MFKTKQKLKTKNSKVMKSRHKLYLGAGLAAVFFSFLLYSCQKDNSVSVPPNKSHLSIYMTDGPGFFDKVWIDVQSIAVKVDTCMNQSAVDDDDQGEHHHEWGDDHDDSDKDNGRGGHDTCTVWDTLHITPGVYDLLNFANGADTLLASGNIPKGKILAFSITLGDHNSLVKDSTSYPLHLLPEWKTIYIRVFNDQVQENTPDHFKLWIDFDAGRSVVRVSDGLFYLRPFIRAFAIDNTGRVEGKVLPVIGAYPVITVFNAKDTMYALPNNDGIFKVPGVWAGTYSVFIQANAPYKDTTVTNVQVQAGMDTNIGTIQLHQ